MKFYNVLISSGKLKGKTRENYLKHIGDKVFNSLYSYWYLKDLTDEEIKDGFSLTKGNIMIDSGAFTAWSKDINIDVDKYIEWINKWDKYATLFGQIDVIPPKTATKQEVDECCKKTWDNYLYMKDRITSPEKLLYTFHYGEDYKWLIQALEYRDNNGKQIEYMALGGLVGRTTKQRIYFLNKCFDIIKHSSNPNIKVHGFGVSSKKLWKKYPFESCDSFTPGSTSIFSFKKESRYMTEGYERIFKPRGWKKRDKIDNSNYEALLIKEKNKREEERIKFMIENIEYWDNLANSIKK